MYENYIVTYKKLVVTYKNLVVTYKNFVVIQIGLFMLNEKNRF